MRFIAELVVLFLIAALGYGYGWRDSSIAWRAWCATGTCYSNGFPPPR